MEAKSTLRDYVDSRLGQLTNLRAAEKDPAYQNFDPKYTLFPLLETILFDPEAEQYLRKSALEEQHELYSNGPAIVHGQLYEGFTDDLFTAFSYLSSVEPVSFFRQESKYGNPVFWKLPGRPYATMILDPLENHGYMVVITPDKPLSEVPWVHMTVSNLDPPSSSIELFRSSQCHSDVSLSGRIEHPVLAEIRSLAEATKEHIELKIR